jgi:Glycosyl hydrolase family 26
MGGNDDMTRHMAHPRRRLAAAVVAVLSAACLGALCLPGALVSAATPSSSAPGAPSSASTTTTSSSAGARTAANALGVPAGPGNVAGANAFAQASGRPVTYAMDFFIGNSWSTIQSPQSVLAAWYGRGYSMIWGVPMLPKSGASLATGATGAYNRHYATLARAMVAAGQGSSIIRLGWEFNGIWFPWGAKGQSSQFVAYWRQIVKTMRSVPGAHFTFEWNPTRGDLGVGNLAAFYPGNAWVDYIGLDVFDVEWQSYPGAKAEFAHIEAGPYGLNWLNTFSKQHKKPMVFPEWGLGWGQSHHGAALTGSGAVGGGDNQVFITNMSRWFATHNVFEATYWDYGSSSVSGKKNQAAQLALARVGASKQSRLTNR